MAVGEIPVLVPLQLTSVQAPPFPVINELFRGLNIPPTQYFGSRIFEPYTDTYLDFLEGQDVTLESIELGNYSTATEDAMLIYGVNFDESEELILTCLTSGSFEITPKQYKRLKFSVKNNSRPNFVKLYGEYTPVTLPPVTFQKYPLSNHFGLNCHPYSLLENANNINIRNTIYAPAHEIIKKYGRTRIYINNPNINEAPDVFGYERDVQGYNIDALITELYYGRPSSQLTPEYLATNPIQYREDGMPVGHVHVVWCMQYITEYMNESYPNQDNKERLPIYFEDDRELEASWETHGEIAFQIAARYGSNQDIDPDLVKSKTGYFFLGDPSAGEWAKKIGLGVLKEIEPYNEMDKWWKGLESYATGKVMAIAMNHIYGRIKEADPDMQVTFCGISTYQPDIIKDFVYWSLKLFGFIPIDNYAFHYYSNSALVQHSGENSTGKSIELSLGGQLAQEFREANFHLLGNKPMDCGEAGYDSTTNSPLRTVVPEGSPYTQREYAAIQYLRQALFNAEQGIRATYWYEFSDNNPGNMWEQFAQMGFIFKTGTSPNVEMNYWPVGFAMAQCKEITEGYVHSERINDTPRVNKWVKGSNVLYSIHSPTENATTGTYNLNLTGVSQVKIIDFSLNSEIPTETIEDIEDSVLSIDYSEKPIFIKINNTSEITIRLPFRFIT